MTSKYSESVSYGLTGHNLINPHNLIPPHNVINPVLQHS